MKWIFTLSLLLSSFAQGQESKALPNLSLRKSHHRVAKKEAPTLPSFKWYNQKLDHFNAADQRSFPQRFIFDSQYAKSPTAPVLYYVCGEGNCMDGELSSDQWVPQMAKQMGAILVALEHRYYGASQPFKYMTTNTFQYLTIEQAIEDLKEFQKWLSVKNELTGKWIAIGGSYPASLAAIYRMEYPELAAGAIASSDCAWTDEGDPSSDQIAAQDLGAACVAKYRKLILEPIEQAIGHPTRMGLIKKIFDASDIDDDLDFLGAISGSAVGMAQYGDWQGFCSALDQPKPMTAFAKELAKSLGGDRLIDSTYTGALQTRSSLYTGDFGFRQWAYQACTQEGLFTLTVMYANPDTKYSLSSSLTNVLPGRYCELYFGLKPPTNGDVKSLNEKYYDPLLKPSTSNILFVNGNKDPACFYYAIAKENGNDINPNTLAYTIDGGFHCQDLDAPTASDSESLKGARDLEIQLATKWTL